MNLVLSAGDLPMDYLDFIISSLNKPLFFVFGNHHTDKMKYFRRTLTPVYTAEEEFPCGAVHLGSRVSIEENLILAGLGGSMRYNRGANQYTDFGMFFEVVKLIPRLLWNRFFYGRFVDILLTHAPPRGVHDKSDKCHLGFKIFLWFMKVFEPKYLVHGHIHLYDLSEVRCTLWRKTTVINAYGHYVIDTG